MYSSKDIKGRESNLVRPIKDGSVEPFPWFVAFEELSSGGSKCRAFQLDLVPDRDAVVADRRDRRLECPASLDSTGPQLGQVKAAPLVKRSASRLSLVVMTRRHLARALSLVRRA